MAKHFKTAFIGAVVLTLCPFLLKAQTSFIHAPEISYSWKKNDRLGFNSKLGAFNSINNIDNNAFVERIEGSLLFSYGISVPVKVGGGYLYRSTTPFESSMGYEHRFIQQLGFVSYLGDRRVSNRVRLEQRVRDNGYRNRFRYRFSYDFPTQGEILDPGENYMILGNEILSTFNSNLFNLENRASVGYGWFNSSKRKFELGLEYRLSDIASGNELSHLFLVSTSLYFNR